MSKRARIYITDFITEDFSVEEKILGDLAEVIGLAAKKESELEGRIEDAACIMMYHSLPVRAATISRLKDCKVIVRCGVGVDNVDRDAARARGIPVCNVPDYGTEDVADMAIAMMLGLMRGMHRLNSRLRANQGAWSYLQAAPIHRVRGQTFGVVGMGRIGTAASHRAKALGMNVVFYDPYVPDGWEKTNGVRRADTLEELLAQANVLSLHCPSTPETVGLIRAEQIALMPRGSFLVNTARGPILDTAAIPPAIRSGQLAGAGIDVLPVEPPPENDALIKAWRDPKDPCHDRVILTPHSAFYSEEGLIDMRTKASHTCRKAMLGQALRNVVN